MRAILKFLRSPSTLLVTAVGIALAACGDSVDPVLAPQNPNLAIGVDPVSGASIETDMDDYLPGESVHLVLKGWAPGEDVRLEMTEDPDTHGDVDTTVTVDWQGEWNGRFYDVQQHDLGVTFTLTGTGQTSGSIATVVFVDAQLDLSIATNPSGIGVTTIAYATATNSCPAGTSGTGTYTLGGSAIQVSNNKYLKFAIPTVAGRTYTGYTWSGSTTVSPASDPGNTSLCVEGSNAAITGTLTLNYSAATATTTTAVVGSPNPSVTGELVTFTATVLDGVTPVTLGTVDFRFGGTDCSTGTIFGSAAALNGSGEATATRAFTAAESGSTVRACYSGETGYGSSNGSTTQTVNKGTVLVTLSDSPDPSVTGQSVTLSATVTAVSPSTGTPSGTVTFYDGGTCATPGTLLGSDATAPWSVATTALGVPGSPYTLLACYGGDGEFEAGSDTESHEVGLIGTTTSVAGSPSTSVSGQTVTFTATVLDGATPVTTGTVDFRIGGADCTTGTVFGGAAALNGSGQATATRAFSATETGSTIRACYSGTVAYATSEGTTTQTVNKASVLVTLSDNIDPSVYGQSITLSATVTAVAPGVGTPTGAVAFYAGGSCAAPGASLGSSPSSPWSVSTAALAAGGYTLLACYAGDSDFLAGSDTEAHTVNKADVEVVLSATPDPSVFGQSVALGATVTAVAPGAGTPTGTVSFYDGGTCAVPGTSLGSDATSPWAGSTTALAVGAHTLIACYGGDANFNPGDDDESQTVNKAATSVTVTTSGSPSSYGNSVTFTATVSVTPPGSGTPTGTLTFYEFSGAQSCAAPGAAVALGSTGTLVGGTYATSSLSVAGSPHTISACYSGDGNFLASGNSVVQVVNAATITSTASVSPTTQQYSDKVTLSTVLDISSGALNSQTLTGSVEFFIGSRSVGTVGVSTTTLSKTVTLTPDTPLTEQPSGTAYVVAAVFTSTNANFAPGTQTDASLTVTKEDATPFDINHPDAVEVTTAGGNAPAINVAGKVKETLAELNANQSLVAPGMINKVLSVTVTLDGVSAGGATMSCTDNSLTSGGTTGYDQWRNFSCDVPAGLPVDTYEVIITVGSDYYVGEYRSVLTVYDPSLGFITGGGTFLLGGDRTNFGFVGKATVNKKNTIIKGSLLVIRHLPDGSIVRMKSNVFDGLAIQTDGSATFSGKANNSVDGNNYDFTAYTKDVATPGAGMDLFGLYYPLTSLRTSSTLNGLVASAKPLTGGNVQVPQPQGGGKKP